MRSSARTMDGIITDWNRGAERLYGYSAQEMIGRPISLLMPADRSDDFQEIVEKLKRGEKVAHYETVRQKKDGTRVDVSLGFFCSGMQRGRLSARQLSPATLLIASEQKTL
jgi:PAS domain S-box-containing protein